MKRCFLLFLLLAPTSCVESATPDEAQPGAIPSTFADAMDGLLKAAQLGRDAELKGLSIKPGVPAPKLLRSFAAAKESFDKERRQMIQPPGPRCSVDHLQFRWQEGRITISWSGQISVGKDNPQGPQVLTLGGREDQIRRGHG